MSSLTCIRDQDRRASRGLPSASSGVVHKTQSSSYLRRNTNRNLHLHYSLSPLLTRSALGTMPDREDDVLRVR